MTRRARLALATLLLAAAAAFLLLREPGAREATDVGALQRPAAPQDPSGPSLEGLPTRETAKQPAPAAPLPAVQHPPTTGPVLDRPDPWLPPAPRLPRMQIRGRLLEADGAPAAHAVVGARARTGADAGSFPLLGGHATDDEGRFEIRVEQAAELELYAWSQRSPPTVVSRHVSPADVVDLGDVVLPLGLLLEGRVLVGGRPSPFGPAAIHVWRREVTGVMGSFERGVVLDSEERPVSASRIVQSAPDGSWKAEGLSPGAYSVRVQHLGGVQLHEALLPAAERSAVAPAPGIEFDLSASLLAVAAEEVVLSSTPPRRVEVTTPDGTRTRILSAHDRGLEGMANLTVPGSEPGDALLLVPSAAALDVRVQDDGFEGWRERVNAAATGEVLRLSPTARPAAMGWIKLRRPPEAQGLTPQLRVRVLAPGADDVVREQTAWLAAPGFEGQVMAPLGTWTVELAPMDAQQASDGELILPQRERVEVGTSLETAPVVTWDPPRGGRIRLRVDGEVADQRKVTCTLQRDGHAPQRVWFRAVIELPGVDRASMWVGTSPLVVGARFESDGPLQPGGVRLRFECEGFEPQEEPVVIRAGVTTDVQVRLVRR